MTLRDCPASAMRRKPSCAWFKGSVWVIMSFVFMLFVARIASESSRSFGAAP